MSAGKPVSVLFGERHYLHILLLEGKVVFYSRDGVFKVLDIVYP